MASILDSFREVYSDSSSLIKVAVLSVPVFYCYQLYTAAKVSGNYDNFFLVSYIVLFFVFGFIIEITNNVINERDRILPSLNPLPLALTSLKGLLAVGPSILISCLAASYLTGYINIIFWLDITLKTIIWLVAASIFLTAYLLFSVNKKIIEAYNVKKIFQKAGDLIVMLIFFVIQLVIINIPTTVFIGYTLVVLFGYGVVFDAFIVFASVFNVAVLGHYLGQVNYEVLGIAVDQKPMSGFSGK